jgi:hypothetical protein
VICSGPDKHLPTLIICTISNLFDNSKSKQFENKIAHTKSRVKIPLAFKEGFIAHLTDMVYVFGPAQEVIR